MKLPRKERSMTHIWRGGGARNINRNCPWESQDSGLTRQRHLLRCYAYSKTTKGNRTARAKKQSMKMMSHQTWVSLKRNFRKELNRRSGVEKHSNCNGKFTVTVMKNSPERLNSGFRQTDEGVSKFEDNVSWDCPVWKPERRDEQSFGDLWDTMKQTNLCKWDSQKERREKDKEGGRNG